MSLSPCLTQAFFSRPTLLVARELLGAHLVRLKGDRRLGGYISETEAYIGENDLACHARVGRTTRNAVMYGPPGHAYVYFTYGMHWMLNIVTEVEGFPAAVLIRAIEPLEGLDLIATQRPGRQRSEWTNGPAKLCQALCIDGQLNGVDVCAREAVIFLEKGIQIPDSRVTISSRVGLNTVPEPWRSVPWRFVADMRDAHKQSG
ncbi:MAG: DNA-3-methyladenine glycosylase [Chloroflexota bacterium]